MPTRNYKRAFTNLPAAEKERHLARLRALLLIARATYRPIHQLTQHHRQPFHPDLLS